MEEYQNLGHMTPLASDVKSPHYFLPHYGVINDNSSTTKLRVVFDGSFKSTNGKNSLNDILLTAGADSLDSARKIVHELQNLMSAGGFELRKWSCIHPEVLSDLPNTLKTNVSSHSFDDESTQKILGLFWDLNEDSFKTCGRQGLTGMMRYCRTHKSRYKVPIAELAERWTELPQVSDESRSFFRVHTGYFSNIPKCIKAEFIASWACSQSSVVSSSQR
ncbi:DUF1758 domain-containing protein [Trichonephila clavipes]|nr:DUF1758 domain-containing protein [Trichonephila clavipes]